MTELASIAAAIKARGETPHPVEPAEMTKILELVMTQGFKLGVNEGMKYQNKEARKSLRALHNAMERQNKPWYTWPF
tara:strand:+ start:1734 stop:1964 length:231 start_codon:yes stop_codon:yes gene_type:complete